MSKKDHRFIEWVMDRACLRKRNYTEEEANIVIERIAEQEQRVVYFYKCQICGSFHTTSRAGEVEQRLVFI